MQNARLEEAQAGIKIARKNINNIRCRWHHPYGRKQRSVLPKPHLTSHSRMSGSK